MSSPLMGGLLPKLKKVSPNQISGLDNGDWQEFGKKLTCKRDFSNILPTVLRLMLKDPFKQSVRTRWRSGIHSGPLGGWWVGLGHFSNWRNIKWMVIIIVNKNSKEKLLGNFFQSWLQTCLPRRTFHHTFVNQFISVRFPPHPND